jgi:hypothetical protein
LAEVAEDVQAGEHEHTMKLALWMVTHCPRRAGPSNRSTIPLANTVGVESTTSGAIVRSHSSGGPFFR